VVLGLLLLYLLRFQATDAWIFGRSSSMALFFVYNFEFSLLHPESCGLVRKLFFPSCVLPIVTFFNLHSYSFYRQEFETIVEGLSDALDFSRTIGVDASASLPYEQGGGRGTLGEVDFYTRCAKRNYVQDPSERTLTPPGSSYL
jgi:hypothetical protein